MIIYIYARVVLVGVGLVVDMGAGEWVGGGLGLG